jgi:hypothetical protein
MENARDPGQSYPTRPIQVKSSQGGADSIRIRAEAGKKNRRGGVIFNRREKKKLYELMLRDTTFYESSKDTEND